MIRFTRRGAVVVPRTLQVRVGPAFAGRVSLGLRPSRALTDAEVLAAVRAHTVDRRGPRDVPCDRLVVSGWPPARTTLSTLLDTVRGWGIAHVTLHAAWDQRPERGPDVVAGVVSDAASAAALGDWPGPRRVAVVPVRPEALEDVPARIAAARADRVALTWPLPPARPPWSAGEAVAHVARAMAGVSVPWAIQGLPACALGPLSARAGRVRHRHYVDADHPSSSRTLALADLVQWTKTDACRGCPAESRCDGVPTAHLRAGWVPGPRPREVLERTR